MFHYWLRVLASVRHASRYIRFLFKWCLYAGVTGIIGGFVGMFFHVSVEWATESRISHPSFIYFLPLVGLIIVGMYDLFVSYEDNSTDTVVRSVQNDGQKISIVIAPLIFLSTVLTHLCGGSAGREGAALQLGGSIGTQVGDWFEVSNKEQRILIMCGMSALFSALFGTPITAIFFSIEVSIVGLMFYSALLPCMISSVVAYAVTRLNGVEPTRFILENTPVVNAPSLVSTVIVAALSACMCIVFCVAIRNGEKLFHHIKNEYLRIIIGGFIIIGLTFAIGTRDYNGAGMSVIIRAVELGETENFAFLLKILFTVITIAAGYKGGEIVPTLFIGATFGCAVARIIGFDAGLGAAVGMTAMFCGMLNCPIASIFLSIELFGAHGLMLFVISAGISYLLSGYYGLYGSQQIVLSKLGEGEINKRINK